MKEIHAYQNEDGTYVVEMKGNFKTIKTIETESFEIINEGKISIPRAGIQIFAYTNGKPDDKIFTLSLFNEDSKQ